ncbi:MAG: phosphoglucosamine mutase [Desulfobacterales bacterium]|nr:phosphoglucosamine mutase [Desulfobacterales bacterium]
MKKFFGTDGIRGKANEFPITAEIALKIGRSIAHFFSNKSQLNNESLRKKILIGKDTRISGDMLEHALVAGICSMGIDVYLAGIIPTPAIAFLTKKIDAIAGIVISASHNPYYDNGIKIFTNDGYKLTDEQEIEIEKLIFEDFDSKCKTIKNMGKVYNFDEGEEIYANFLIDAVNPNISLKGMKIVVDCANGATYQIVPYIFKKFLADVDAIFISPNGKNINDSCGSEYPSELKKRVIDSNADLGLAFDGDGDRLIAIDGNGKQLTGDHIIAILAKYLKSQGLLKNNIVVSTVMSNLGLDKALRDMDIIHKQATVGDRYVLEEMLKFDASIGGENSGHIILNHHQTTGDGILTALKLIESIKYYNKKLSDFIDIINLCPQIMVNVHVNCKLDLNSFPEIKQEIESGEKELGTNGRVFVRYSGTEPLCRVMVEAFEFDKAKNICESIANIIKDKIGKE